MLKVLFLCTHNRCRSIMAEAIARTLAAGVIEARSAGSAPAGEVHPLTLHYLSKAGFSTQGLSSKSWYALEGFDPDCVITLCDSAAAEACPVFLGRAQKRHWGLDDPSKYHGEQADEAFHQCIAILKDNIQALVNEYQHRNKNHGAL